MRRSFEPGMRYPRSAPESNHLLTVRGATLQILATSPVVKTSLTLLLVVELVLMAFSPVASWFNRPVATLPTVTTISSARVLRTAGPLCSGNTLYIDSHGDP